MRCGVAQRSVWVIHHTNTAGGHSLAQRYAEQEENNVLRLHPLNLIETHSTGATFTHPPQAHFINLVLAPYFLPDNPGKQTHKTDTWVLHHGGRKKALQYCVCQPVTCGGVM